MPSTIIANFDAGRIPDVTDEANFHTDATYVFEHMASDIIPGINTNLDWMNAVLSGSETIVDALADLQAFADLFPALTGRALLVPRVTATEDAFEYIAVQAFSANLTAFLTALSLPEVDGTAGQTLASDGTGNVVFSEPPLGLGQEWIALDAERTGGVVYQNTTGRTIAVMTWTGNNSASAFAEVSKDNVTWVSVAAGVYDSGYFTVPAGHYYKDNNAVTKWSELREPA